MKRVTKDEYLNRRDEIGTGGFTRKSPAIQEMQEPEVEFYLDTQRGNAPYIYWTSGDAPRPTLDTEETSGSS